MDVNNAGEVTGTISYGSVHEAFLWHPSTGFSFWPGLKGGSPMYVVSSAVDDAGRVVGGRGYYGPNWGPSRAFILAPGGPWQSLGHALAGTNGEPRLLGSGSLELGSGLQLDLSEARATTLGVWVIGFSAVYLLFRGWIAVPRPQRLTTFTPDALGVAAFRLPGLPSLPSGFTIYAQAWLRDPLGPQGAAASNAVLDIVP